MLGINLVGFRILFVLGMTHGAADVVNYIREGLYARQMEMHERKESERVGKAYYLYTIKPGVP